VSLMPRQGSRAKTADAPQCSPASILGVQTLIVEDFPSTALSRALSPNGRVHWTTKNAARLAVHKQIVVEALAINLRPVRGPVRLTFRYVFPDERKRDIDNLTTGVTKCAIDALVRTKVLAADDSEHVTEVKAVAVVEKGARRLEIEIAPATEARAGERGE
jgi:Holliday junction resolvase RusA-like endonuclease